MSGADVHFRLNGADIAARADVLDTSIPGAGARQQDGASTRSPLISTMHARQLPSGRIPGV